MKVKVYTDGSYYAVDGLAHGGFVLMDFPTAGETRAMHIVSTIPQFTTMRNVGGEILAAWYALKLLYTGLKRAENFTENEYDIELVYDYEGVGKWVSGEWRANKQATKWYRDWMQRMQHVYPNVHVKFMWTKGHAGTLGNELADAVACYDTSYCVQNNIPVEDVTPLLREEARW